MDQINVNCKHCANGYARYRYENGELVNRDIKSCNHFAFATSVKNALMWGCFGKPVTEVTLMTTCNGIYCNPFNKCKMQTFTFSKDSQDIVSQTLKCSDCDFFRK
jgi:hypothetical protein